MPHIERLEAASRRDSDLAPQQAMSLVREYYHQRQHWQKRKHGQVAARKPEALAGIVQCEDQPGQRCATDAKVLQLGPEDHLRHAHRHFERIGQCPFGDG